MSKPFPGFVSDQSALALCIWREARGEGYRGMIAVACVIRNRVHKRVTSYVTEVYRPLQFSSVTAPGDPQLGLFPVNGDPIWAEAQDIATGIRDGQIADITGGATVYYAFRSIPFPHDWNPAALKFTCDIGNHRFYREL